MKEGKRVGGTINREKAGSTEVENNVEGGKGEVMKG